MNKFINTRDEKDEVLGSLAIINGLGKNSGLYTFDEIKKIDLNNLFNNCKIETCVDYKKLANLIISNCFCEFDNNDLTNAINQAYSKFYITEVVKTSKIGDDFLMELYNGPTSAFKDIALTLLPHLMSLSYKINNINKTIYILCATSGDTGKAALEGFKDVKNTFITVFYPKNAVSKIQELQMLTTDGQNTDVVSINSNFDVCQNIVKNLMDNREKILTDDVIFSSANSINIGRLVPQIVYYFKSYFDLVCDNQIKFNEKINFSVPTGNFGDILAGYIAKKMGLPINKLICASNKNNVLYDFINTGIYDINRNFYETISPSMDIIISSNLERLLFYETDKNFDKINYLYNKLKIEKKFEISKNELNSINETFYAAFSDDFTIKDTIKDTFINKNRLIDTHTACAVFAVSKYKKETGDKTKNVILATASPYKFAKSVYTAICDKNFSDEFEYMNNLYDLSGEPIPKNLSILSNLTIKHNNNISQDEAINYIKNIIKNL